jgi:hypothetical protein
MAPISPSIPIIDLSLPKAEVTKQIKSAMTVYPPSLPRLLCSSSPYPRPSPLYYILHAMYLYNTYFQTVGFIYIKNHGIPQHEIDAAFQMVPPASNSLY